jgi:hypothetical protein
MIPFKAIFAVANFELFFSTSLSVPNLADIFYVRTVCILGMLLQYYEVRTPLDP